jgi:hypothetical protein
MQDLPKIVTPKAGDDLRESVTAMLLEDLAALPNASWTIALPSGSGGTASVHGSRESVVLDFSKAKIGAGSKEVVVTGSLNGQPASGIAIFKTEPDVI